MWSEPHVIPLSWKRLIFYKTIIHPFGQFVVKIVNKNVRLIQEVFLMAEFSELVKRKRLEKGLSIRALENLTEQEYGHRVSRAIIGFMEMGTTVPTYEIALVLSGALGINTSTALRLAYRSRLEHFKKREQKYLREAVVGTSEGELDTDKIAR